MKEIRARVDRKDWRRLAEVTVVAAEIHARNERHTTGLHFGGKETVLGATRFAIEALTAQAATSPLTSTVSRSLDYRPVRSR